MKIKRILGLAVVLAALVAAFPISGYAADDGKDLSVYFRPAVRFGTDNRTLYILDFLAPVYRGDKGLLFVNAKFTPSDVDTWEVNTGLGYRRLVVPDKLVLGGNIFYDHRKTGYGNHFDQIGLGFEALADVNGVGLTGRINYYQPLEKAKLGTGSAYEFFGNAIYGAGVEEPMVGFDYEAGVRIPGISNYMETWAYAGGYHFFGTRVPNVNGFSARLEAMPTDFMRLNFEFRNDNVDHDQYYGEVAFELPFSIDNLLAGKNPFEGIGHVFTGSRSLKERMVEPVRRDVDIYVKGGVLSPEDAASNGTFEEGIIFVDANAAGYPGTPDGSFEHPYGSFSAASGDSRLGTSIFTIHVLPGNGSGLSGYDFSIPNLTIWGAGATNPKYPHVADFTPGYPLIYNGYLSFDAPNVTVMGMEFDTFAPDGAIEFGNGAAGAPFTVTDNIIDNFGSGIVASLDGDIGAEGAPVVIARNDIMTHGGEGWPHEVTGIGLNTSDGDVYASIFKNNVHDITAAFNFSGGLDAYGIYVSADGNIAGSIADNTVSYISADDALGAYAAGIYADARYDLLASISNNTVSNIQADDTMFWAGATGIYAYAGNNVLGSITGNAVKGIYAGISLGDDDDAADDDDGTYFDGNSPQAEAYGIAVEANGSGDDDDSGDIVGSITGNQIEDVHAQSDTTSGYAEAYGINASAEGNMRGDISGNSIAEISATMDASGGGDDDGYGDDDDDTSPNLEAGGIYLYTDYDLLGSISNNIVKDVSAGANNGYAYAALAYGINADVDYFVGSITGNNVSHIEAYSAYSYAAALGINGDAYDDFTGSITNNTIDDVGAYNAYELDAAGIAINFDAWINNDETGDFNGSIYKNTISHITAEDAYEAYAHGIFAYCDYDFAGSISGNTIDSVTADDASIAAAFGIRTETFGDFDGTISDNTIGNIEAFDASNVLGMGIGMNFYSWYDEPYSTGAFNGAITGNAISNVSATDGGSLRAFGILSFVYNDYFVGSIARNTIENVNSEGYASGIYVAADYGGFSGSITANTLTDIVGTNNEVDGIYVYTEDVLAGEIDNNSITVAGNEAVGIDLAAYMHPITASVTFNTMNLTGLVAYGLYADSGYPDLSSTLGTLAQAMIFIGNKGTLNATTAYAAYLNAGNPEESNVYIGSGFDDMGQNNFTTTGVWGGNYLTPGGPIWASGYPGINFIHH